jgi:molecular chaperone HscA
LAEARLDADRICLATRSALQADGHWLETEYRFSIEKAIDDLIAAKTANDPSIIEASTKALSQATESFAAQRMNRGIQQALAGKNIESI